MRRKDSNVMMTEVEQDLIKKNYLYVISYINKKYGTLSKDIREELTSQAFYEISIRIKNFDATKGNFLIFMKNIMESALRNYYIRVIKNYKQISHRSEISSKDLEERYIKNKKEYEENMKLYKEGKIEKKPLKKQVWESQKTFDINLYGDNNDISHIDSCEKEYEVFEIIDIIDSYVESYDPVRRKFLYGVIHKGESPIYYSKKINQELTTFISTMKKYEEISNNYIFMKNINKFKETIDNDIYKYVVNVFINNKDLNKTKKQVLLKSGHYEKELFIKKISKELKNRGITYDFD